MLSFLYANRHTSIHMEHWYLGFVSLLNQVIHKFHVLPAPSSRRRVPE